MLKKAFAILTILIVLSVTTACGAAEPTSEAKVAVESTAISTVEPTEVGGEPAEEVATPTLEPTMPPTSAEVVITALTAQEFYDLALDESLKWQSDAVLSRMDSGALQPLDSEGRGEGWSAQFYSPSAKEMNLVSLINGEIKAISNPYPGPPDIVPDMESVNLDVKGLYDTVATAAGSEYAEGYDIIAGLRPDVLDNSVPAWTFIYLEVGKPEPVFTVIVDARSGQVLRAGQL
jgi:hypothetical protein